LSEQDLLFSSVFMKGTFGNSALRLQHFVKDRSEACQNGLQGNGSPEDHCGVVELIGVANDSTGSKKCDKRHRVAQTSVSW
jgi:hypothetical protein